ncbi:MAG: GAP family protein [Mycobacterium sp.]
MWLTVLVLSIAVNLEPTRIGLLPLLLSRQNPLMQLLAYLAGGMTVSLGFGFLVLFVFHRNPFGVSASGGGKVQVAVGALALVIAAVMALRGLRKRARSAAPAAAESTSSSESPSGVDKFTIAVRKILGRGRSPWFSCLVGVGTGLPSVDYLALLLVIATSGKSRFEQGAALIICVLVSSIVVITPLIGYLAAPTKTLALIERFNTWTRSRTTIEYAGLLALIGILLIGLGWSHI